MVLPLSYQFYLSEQLERKIEYSLRLYYNTS